MKLRFIKLGKKDRFVVRGPFTEDSLNLSHLLFEMGYKPASFVGYWVHVVLWRRKKKKIAKETKPVLSK